MSETKTIGNNSEFPTNIAPQIINQPPLHLWISSEWFIPVDSTGRCIGTCFEGALGFVVKLESATGDGILALKLPRLMGETYRENAYINDLMEKELWAVKKVFVSGRKKEDSVNPEALLRADISLGSILRGYIKTDKGNQEAKNWNDSLVFVHYEKGSNPQFCLVKCEQDKVKKFPPESKCPIQDKNAYDLVLKYSKSKEINWTETIFVVDKESKNSNPDNTSNELEIFSIRNLRNQDRNIWYTALPSIIYDWAPGTLQEVISRKQREPWDIRKHLDLTERLCKGLDVLHSKQMLHADLRPANVTYLGDEQKPENYFLSDYGSFAQANPHCAARQAIDGKTVIGPNIGGERTSPFYSPERRLGREREEADTAIVYHNDNDIHLILGWRSELIDAENDKPKEKEILQLIQESKKDKSQQDNTSKEILNKGDRIQVREYIFELSAKERTVGNKQILQCKE